nr:hypothetical protein CcurKRNrm2_p142 [Cryptomonas curvata]
MLKLNNRCSMLVLLKRYILIFSSKIKRLIVEQHNYPVNNVLYSKNSIFFFYFSKILEKIRHFLFIYDNKLIYLKKISCRSTKIIQINFLNYLQYSISYFKYIDNYLGGNFLKSKKVFFLLNYLQFSSFILGINIKNLIYWSLIVIEKKKIEKNIEKLSIKKKNLTKIKKFIFFFRYIFKNSNLNKFDIINNKYIHKNNLFFFLKNTKKKMGVGRKKKCFKIILGVKNVSISSFNLSLGLWQKNFGLILLIIYLDYISVMLLFYIKSHTFFKNRLNNSVLINYLGFFNCKKEFSSYFNFLKYKKNQIYYNFLTNVLLFFDLLQIQAVFF